MMLKEAFSPTMDQSHILIIAGYATFKSCASAGKSWKDQTAGHSFCIPGPEAVKPIEKQPTLESPPETFFVPTQGKKAGKP